jgi:lactate dehydrogenase-like 2-hydroxyacid dehydrogenase
MDAECADRSEELLVRGAGEGSDRVEEEPMRPRVFVVQPIPEVALDILREVADVEVYPYMDRQITTDELANAARRSDYLFAMHETTITREVIFANPNPLLFAISGYRRRG